jgi:hypothetical protein
MYQNVAQMYRNLGISIHLSNSLIHLSKFFKFYQNVYQHFYQHFDKIPRPPRAGALAARPPARPPASPPARPSARPPARKHTYVPAHTCWRLAVSRRRRPGFVQVSVESSAVTVPQQPRACSVLTMTRFRFHETVIYDDFTGDMDLPLLCKEGGTPCHPSRTLLLLFFPPSAYRAQSTV